jgi:hypothetical protein|tara:strand:+ start:282 stop:425 length:144 start_codon:yes stop_codon:yes gene_type:complete
MEESSGVEEKLTTLCQDGEGEVIGNELRKKRLLTGNGRKLLIFYWRK